MATGVLPMVTGNFTRLVQFYTESEKVYEGTVRFGFSTDTYDADGEATSDPKNVTLSREEVEGAAAKFHGVIEQLPPPFSAKKIHGVPAYKLARKNKEVTLKPVQVEIKEFAILSVDEDRCTFRARVASGTYMRSVAHEMGQQLGCGAHLEALRRTMVGDFAIENAHSLDEMAKAAQIRVEEPACVANGADVQEDSQRASGMPIEREAQRGGDSEGLRELFVHPRTLLPQFPCVTADEQTVAKVRSGCTVNLFELSRARQIKVFAGQRELVAIATRVAGTLFHPKIVLCGS
jgi:tRNA pseudouridine55 synthase